MLKWIVLLMAASCCVTGCAGPEGALTLSAAASTREALEEIVREFQRQTGTRVNLNFGPSSTLAQQIKAGGPAELFLSADEAWADYLDKANLVEHRFDLLGNRLVVVVPRATSVEQLHLQDLAGPSIRHLALAGPGVPAGEYARQSLKKLGIWDDVRDRIVSGKDVRGALALVEQGEADAGIVYRTDALVSHKTRIAADIPERLHLPVRYPLVLVRQKSIRPEARQLFEFLNSAAAADLFRHAGFETNRSTEY